MGKRSDFKRIDKDFYPTPYKALVPLLPHLKQGDRIYEPCSGNLDLVTGLQDAGMNIVGFSDIDKYYYANNPIADATTTQYQTKYIDYFVTNPPWSRDLLHPIIENLSNQRPTWLLFDADWAYTKQATKYLNRLRKIVVVGRVKWIKDSNTTGKDNCCWYLFDKPKDNTTIEFYGKQ